MTPNYVSLDVVGPVIYDTVSSDLSLERVAYTIAFDVSPTQD